MLTVEEHAEMARKAVPLIGAIEALQHGLGAVGPWLGAGAGPGNPVRWKWTE